MVNLSLEARDGQADANARQILTALLAIFASNPQAPSLESAFADVGFSMRQIIGIAPSHPVAPNARNPSFSQAPK
jgi:hypothetical protein